ncbi:MAG: SDR family oxidoreductase [Deltaproteobacteria bacterium]|nr:SDR family oxidoreductase [Deltaproteobacteria bacterium]
MTFNPMDLTGKRILVTGASSGIGKATARYLSNLGAKVVLLARNAERLQKTFDSLSGEGHAQYIFDLTALDEIPVMIKKIAQEVGRFSGLFHAAGITNVIPVGIIGEKYIDAVFDPSIKAVLMLARGFCQKGVLLTDNASLIFMSSVFSLRGIAGTSIYCASKAAIDGAVRALACELAPRAIRVNSIIVGAVETTMLEKLCKTLTKEYKLAFDKKHLLGFGKPEDIAAAASFLLSDASRWITGSTMIVDGGYYCS